MAHYFLFADLCTHNYHSIRNRADSIAMISTSIFSPVAPKQFSKLQKARDGIRLHVQHHQGFSMNFLFIESFHERESIKCYALPHIQCSCNFSAPTLLALPFLNHFLCFHVFLTVAILHSLSCLFLLTALLYFCAPALYAPDFFAIAFFAFPHFSILFHPCIFHYRTFALTYLAPI